jgi:hypothetical protein
METCDKGLSLLCLMDFVDAAVMQIVWWFCGCLLTSSSQQCCGMAQWQWASCLVLNLTCCLSTVGDLLYKYLLVCLF